MPQIHHPEPAAPAVSRRPLPCWIWNAAVVALAGLVSLAAFAVHQWPFTRSKLISALQEQTGSKVQIASFRQIYFPHPGCVATGVTFVRGGSAGTPPLIKVEKLIIRGSYAGLLTHHVDQIQAVHMRVMIAPNSPALGDALGPIRGGVIRSGLSIGSIVADGAEVDITASSKPLAFYVQKLAVSLISDKHPFSFQARLQLPDPPSIVNIGGKFGPWNTGNAGQTPLSGNYTMEQANLGAFQGIAGTLSAKGDFHGVLQHLDTNGTTDIPDFVLMQAGHAVHVTAEYQAVVNGLNGDVALEPVTAHYGKTMIISIGTVESEKKGEGKTLSLEMYANQARIEDLLRLVTSTNPPSMTGAIRFRAKVTVPPEDRPLLRRVKLEGDFGIAGGQYTNPTTQKNVDVASARARGEADKVQDENDKRGNDSYDPGKVLSNVQGHVVLRNAVAHLTNLSFDVPGASALLSGTYALETERVDLKGMAQLDAKLSQATTGVKSFLLKIVQPLVKKKQQQGSVVSLKVGGTYHNPAFTVTPVVKK